MLVKDLRSRGLKSRSDPCGAAIDSRLSRRCFRAAGRNLPGSTPGSTPFGNFFAIFLRDDGRTGVPRGGFSGGTAGGLMEEGVEAEEREGPEGSGGLREGVEAGF